ncbi:urea ABC transporter ATP-binding protein UrtD [Rhodobacter sp. Har01]|uniref:urea ABC transporter ATP-binding protein UrtD n=1 Tax=Rhodobacter sp. Har01 TaxID=2883999 RepID=UPI001D05DB09|nr:urea ABC transporter ATP-binding protein UrtD [Rhodobacter sp. Har01]MCB6179952.1 urea ABC transporter ATP-binding protein UrtD [Rhodobacter sp. Har01]
MTEHLHIEGLGVEFNGFKAVNDLNLSVAQGELRCLIGPNGAGKTTTLDLICGKTRPMHGSIRYRGREIARLPEFQIARAGIGRKFQVPSVFRQLTVRENLEVAHCKHISVYTNILRSGRSAESDGLEKLAAFVDLSDYFEAPASVLSHGQTQWLEIALLLAQDSELILLDEPAAGMTHQETQKTADICNRLKGKHTIIVVEHDMGFVRQIAQVVSVMHQGTLLMEGTVEEISRDQRVREVYLGSTLGI